MENVMEATMEDKTMTAKKTFPKLLIISNMCWGKDTFAEILRDNFGLRFTSSSQAAADIFLYDKLKEKYGYKTSEECFLDRVNHRAEWYDEICEYNLIDKSRLAKEILKNGDCYVGMRDRHEVDDCKNQKIFDLVVWIDASKRLPPEPKDSCTVSEKDADIIIDNNGTLAEFEERVKKFGKVLTR